MKWSDIFKKLGINMDDEIDSTSKETLDVEKKVIEIKNDKEGVDTKDGEKDTKKDVPTAEEKEDTKMGFKAPKVDKKGFYDLTNIEDEDMKAFFKERSDSLEDVGDSASDSSIDIEGAKKALGNMTGTSKLADGNMVKLAKSLGLSGAQAAALGIAFTAVVAIVKYMNEQMDEFIDLLKDGAGDIGSGFIDVLKDIPDMLSEMVDALQEANEQMLEFAEAGSEIENAYRVMYNYFGQDAGDKVADYADNLESVFGLDATGVIDQIGKLESTVTKLTSSKDQIDSLTQSLDMFARDLSAFAGEDYAKVVSDLSRAISNGSVMKGSSLYDIMSKGQIDELKALETEQERYNYIMKNSSAIKGAYTRYLDTEAGKIEI